MLRVDKPSLIKVKILGEIYYQIKSEAPDWRKKFAFCNAYYKEQINIQKILKRKETSS